MPPVIYADRSAKSFANFSIKKFGINPNNLTMLLDNDATAKKIETKLLQITKRINKNDTLLFYYSGHSAPDFNGNNAFLIPSDTSPGFYKDPFFSVKNFYNFLSNINAKNVIVILDTCFAGKTDENTYIFGDIAPIINMTSSLNVSPNKKITLLTSSKGDQISNSHRTKGHRLFTYYFLQEYLKKQTFNESTFKSIKEQVNSKSLKIGIANEQTPTIDGENFEKFFMLIE